MCSWTSFIPPSHGSNLFFSAVLSEGCDSSILGAVLQMHFANHGSLAEFGISKISNDRIMAVVAYLANRSTQGWFVSASRYTDLPLWKCVHEMLKVGFGKGEKSQVEKIEHEVA